MKAVKYIGLTVAALALSNCANKPGEAVRELYGMTPQAGTPFTRALTDEYRSLANAEVILEDEWSDAEKYAQQGLRSARGDLVLPWNPAAYSGHDGMVPDDLLPPLISGRAQLLAAFDRGARERWPAAAAHVQALYDCWVEESAEVVDDSNELGRCRDGFLAGIGKLGISHAFTVFFDRDEAVLDDAAERTVRQAADGFKLGRYASVAVVGHTDTAGSSDYNLALSERRAAATRAELIRDGVPAKAIKPNGVGENELLVPTPDQTLERKNRRVVIDLQ